MAFVFPLFKQDIRDALRPESLELEMIPSSRDIRDISDFRQTLVQVLVRFYFEENAKGITLRRVQCRATCPPPSRYYVIALVQADCKVFLSILIRTVFIELCPCVVSLRCVTVKSIKYCATFSKSVGHSCFSTKTRTSRCLLQ